jgi:hypothetical protein
LVDPVPAAGPTTAPHPEPPAAEDRIVRRSQFQKRGVSTSLLIALIGGGLSLVLVVGAVVLAVVVFLNNQNSPRSLIVGKWKPTTKRTEGIDVFEFTSDNRHFVYINPGFQQERQLPASQMTGRYRFLDDERVEIEVDRFDARSGPPGRQVYEVSVTANTLVLINARTGGAEVLHRIP